MFKLAVIQSAILYLETPFGHFHLNLIIFPRNWIRCESSGGKRTSKLIGAAGLKRLALDSFSIILNI